MQFKLSQDAMIQITDSKSVIYHLKTDELFSVEGDLHLLCELFLRARELRKSFSEEEVKKFLEGQSESFQKNPDPLKSIEAALRLFKDLKVLEDA